MFIYTCQTARRHNPEAHSINCNTEEQIHPVNPIVTRLLKKWDLKVFYRVQNVTLFLVTNNELN